MKLLTRASAEFLIIDDDPAITKFLVTYLKQKGHTCEFLTEGFRTASWLEHNQCDVVVVDLNMPKVDGISLIALGGSDALIQGNSLTGNVRGGIFLTGGNQMRLSSIVAGTPLARKVKQRNRDGVVVAGTSAGASILSSHMVAYGASGPSPRMRMVQMTAGFDLVPGVVIDQHFRQRDRIGRLLALVAGSPGLLGIGIDEDTAALFTGHTMEVLGRHSVTIVDGTNIVSDIHRVKGHGPITVSGAILHVLSAGNRFDMIERCMLPNESWNRVVEKPRRRR